VSLHFSTSEVSGASVCRVEVCQLWQLAHGGTDLLTVSGHAWWRPLTSCLAAAANAS